MRDPLGRETSPRKEKETREKQTHTHKEKERKQQQELESTGPNLEEGGCF
jgi:hypothetical protein|tara:strand:+ start:279 stop:428 length:150 start_codon:yes stop_codon:yes gene_type:complete